MWQSVIISGTGVRLRAAFYQSVATSPGRAQILTNQFAAEIPRPVEGCFEGECKLSGSVLGKMCEAFGRFVHTGTMPLRNPPQGHVHAGELLKPGFPLPQKLGMRGFVNVMPQGANALPHRHVDQ